MLTGTIMAREIGKGKKTRFVKLRVDDRELEEWKARAGESGMTLSGLLRKAMRRVKPFSPGHRHLLRERNRQIARIGNNLNQIARWANTHKSAADTFEVTRHLIAIQRELERLARSG